MSHSGLHVAKECVSSVAKMQRCHFVTASYLKYGTSTGGLEVLLFVTESIEQFMHLTVGER